MVTRPDSWPPRVYDEDLAQELHDMGAGLIPPPSSQAKRHHFVPQFWVRQFHIQGDESRVFQLAASGGAPQQVRAANAASKRRLYGVEVGASTYDNRIEAFLGIFERHGAPALRLLCDFGSSPTEGDVIAISMLLGLQMSRAPSTLDAVGDLAELHGLAFFAALASSPSALRTYVERNRGASITDTDLEETRAGLMQVLVEGGIRLDGKREVGLAAMVDQFLGAGEFVAHADWILLAPDGARFVLNDVGFARIRSTDGLPTKEALVFPLRPDRCLLVQPPTDTGTTLRRMVCSASEARKINLRTFAWADQYIYGSSQADVADVKAAARRDRRLAQRPDLGEHPYLAGVAQYFAS